MGDSMLEASPDALFGVQDDRVVYVNRRGALLLGLERDVIVGCKTNELLEEADLARLRELERQQQLGWTLPETFRAHLKRSAGSVLVDLRFAREGEMLVLSARDMTETSRGERLIARLAELAAHAETDVQAFLSAAEPLIAELGWTLAYSLVDDGTIVPTWVLGRPDDPITQYGRSILGQHLDARGAPIAMHVLQTGAAVFLDNLPSTRAEALDQHMTEARVRRSVWAPVWVDGKIAAVLSVAGADLTDHDFVAIQLLSAQLGAVTRSARLQAELLRRARLAATGETIAMVIHEARQPVSVLSTALPILERSVASASGHEAVAMVREETERLKRLLGELREFARPNDLSVEVLELHPLVLEVVRAASHVMPVDTEIIIEVDPALRVRADREQLRRVLYNLVENAFQHVEREGDVRVRAAVIGSACRLSIANDGPSIDSATRARIFEPFFTTRAEGTGLGLFVAQHALSTMSGRLELDDVPSGVQFSAWIPLAIAAVA